MPLEDGLRIADQDRWDSGIDMHPILERQLRKHLDPSPRIPASWWALLEDVSKVYQDADALRADQNLPADVASRKILERNQQLESANDSMSAAMQWLRSTLECTAD